MAAGKHAADDPEGCSREVRNMPDITGPGGGGGSWWWIIIIVIIVVLILCCFCFFPIFGG